MKQHQHIVVLGAASSGLGAAILAATKGYSVFVSDKGTITLEAMSMLKEHDIPFEQGKHSTNKILKASIVIKSPGIPNHISLIKEIQKKEIPIISDIEWASLHTQIPIIAVTGSNGKTTTTELITHLLINCKINAIAVGNIGFSFGLAISLHKPDFWVVEISSFQLDFVDTFQPQISLILNITPDHLDRYEYSINKYSMVKLRITENQTPDQHCILHDSLQINTKANVIAVPYPLKLSRSVHLHEHTFFLNKQSLLGLHNQFNAFCAIKAALLVGAMPECIQLALNTFNGPKHRMQYIGSYRNVDFINDSKATNVDATYFALQAVKPKIVWIVGGTDKGNNYKPILDLVGQKVSTIICLGVDNQKLLDTFSVVVDKIYQTQSMSKAVNIAFDHAEPYSTVLLSPAAASFDLFKNYIDRGIQFQNSVKRLIAKV